MDSRSVILYHISGGIVRMLSRDLCAEAACYTVLHCSPENNGTVERFPVGKRAAEGVLNPAVQCARNIH